MNIQDVSNSRLEEFITQTDITPQRAAESDQSPIVFDSRLKPAPIIVQKRFRTRQDRGDSMENISPSPTPKGLDTPSDRKAAFEQNLVKT